MQNPGVERSPRGTQLLIVYSAVTIIVVYYALTAWVPWVVQYMRTHLDRRKVLDVLRDEVKDGTDEALAELRNYKHRKTDTTTPKPAMRARPNFVLTTKTIPVRSSSSTSTEEQATPATRIPSPTQSRRPPMFQPKQTASKASVVSTDSTAQYPSRDLSTFTSDSVEARLHQSRGIRSSGTSSSTVSELNEQRALRERQDAEYKRSEQLDLERQSEAKAKQVLRDMRFVSEITVLPCLP
jgi:type IV secretory pathway VirB10-like protein